MGSSLRGKEKTPARSWEQQRSYFPLDRGYLRRGPTLQATSSPLLSLTVKSTDQFTLIVPQSDSVTFSTGRYRFDINLITITAVEWVATEHVAFSLKPLGVNAYRSRWATIQKRANVPYRDFHSIRHTHASVLIALGYDIKFVQERLGHSSAKITLDTYGHLFEERKFDKSRDNLRDNLLGVNNA